MEEEKECTLLQKVVNLTDSLSKEVIKELLRKGDISISTSLDDEIYLTLSSEYAALHISANVVAMDTDYSLIELNVDSKREIISQEEFDYLRSIFLKIREAMFDISYESVESQIKEIKRNSIIK